MQVSFSSKKPLLRIKTLQHLNSQLTPILKNILHVANDNCEGRNAGQKGNTVPVYVMRMYGGVRVTLHPFLNLASDRGEYSVSRSGRSIPMGVPSGIHLIGGWVLRGASLVKVKVKFTL